ncbi:hypothetical protein ACOTW1_22900, partial [Enterobacter cloacae complex sp. IR1532]
MTETGLHLKARPSGVPNQTPCYNVASRRRRRFLNRWIRSLATPAGRQKIKAELRRRIRHNRYGTVAKLAMRQPFVLFKGLTFQKLCLPGAFRPGDHHNKML